MLNSTNAKWSKIIKKVEYDGEVLTGDKIEWPLVQMVGGCVIFNPENHFSNAKYQADKELFFTLESEYISETIVNIYVLSRGQPGHRHLKHSHKSHVGSDIQLVVGWTSGYGSEQQSRYSRYVKKYLLTPTPVQG